jgi:hypothetical protein
MNGPLERVRPVEQRADWLCMIGLAAVVCLAVVI